MKIMSLTRRAEKTWWNRLVFLFKILLATGLILFLYRSGRLDLMVVARAYEYPIYLVTGGLCCTLAVVTPIFRWWILTRIQKLPLSGFDALRLTMIGYFFNLIIPGGSGGDVIRAAYTVRDCWEKKAHALTIVFVDRGLGLHALFFLSGSIIYFQPALLNNYPDLKPWLFFIVGTLIIITVLPLFLVWERTNGFVMRICGRVIGGAEAWKEAMQQYRQKPGMLCLAYFFSFGSAVFNVFAIHFMMLAVGSTPTIIESLVIAPLVILANTLPFTPGGVGVAEGASAVLYALVAQTGGANGMLLARFFIVIHALMGLPFFLINKNREIREVALQNETAYE